MRTFTALESAPDQLATSRPFDLEGRTLRAELPVDRIRTRRFVSEDLLPLATAFGELLGTPGLRRGSTLILRAPAGRGAFGLGVGLIAEASAKGAWCAGVDLSGLGLLAAGELGVALDRFAVVPSSKGRLAEVVSSLLEGFDIVLAGLRVELPASQARRLIAKARKHRAVLVLVPFSDLPAKAPGWPEPADVELSLMSERFLGLGVGDGRITARLVEIKAIRRHAVPHERRMEVWLPSPEGAITLGDSLTIDSASHVQVAGLG